MSRIKCSVFSVLPLLTVVGCGKLLNHKNTDKEVEKLVQEYVEMQEKAVEKLKTFLGKLSTELMGANDRRRGRDVKENDFVFFLYHSIFWENEVEEYEYLNSVIATFELEKDHLYNALTYLRNLDTEDMEWLLKQMKIDYMTPTDIICAIVELAFEVVCLLECREF